jgi:hypothetical protein
MKRGHFNSTMPLILWKSLATLAWKRATAVARWDKDEPKRAT